MAKRSRPDWAKLREALWLRSGGHCEVSGLPLRFDGFDAHHRRPKGMGGTYRPDTDTLPNLLALDPAVHNGGPGSVHADRPWSEDRGWLLPKGTALALSWPVWLWQRRWVVLTPEGAYRPLNALPPPGSRSRGAEDSER